MVCPQCGAEFVPGIERCADCEIPLVSADPESGEPEATEWSTALATGDPALLAAAESLLIEADVPFRTRNEGLQDLFAFGRLGMGYNPVVGPVRLDVPAQRLAEVQELLAALDEYAGLDEDSLPSG
jgi:hypothetical protein